MANETSGPSRKRRSQKCPACGAISVPIVYGMPSTDLVDASERGEIAIGGCLVTSDKPTRRCENGHEWRNRAGGDPTHPVAILRSRLASDFVDDLPDGVHPVDEWCADPQFFPGATGLLASRSWADVMPGRAGVLDELPPVVEYGVIVVGNYQATLASYRRILDGSVGGFPTTWRVLRQVIAGSPR